MTRLPKLRRMSLQRSGRNNQGVITVRHRGGGNKKLYRIIDFKRSIFQYPAVVKEIEIDPNRTSRIALICYQKGILSYILAYRGIAVGSIIQSGPSVDILSGNSLPIGKMPVGTFIHNVELKPGHGGQLIRAAGTSGKIVKRDKRSASTTIKSSSGELYNVSSQCTATIGIVSNEDHKNVILRKAGQSRWQNRRPVVRGVAMNPVDHPHGGGEGKSKGGRHPVSPWGKLAKGKATSSRRISTKRKAPRGGSNAVSL